MDNISIDVWKRKGSCVIFDEPTLGPLIDSGALVSLRQFMSWAGGLPANPPVTGSTILACGLETVIETMPSDDADEFLAKRVRSLLIEIQNRWTNCGVVLGFSAHATSFEETPLNEEVLFKRPDRKKVRLSDGLWDGSATVNMKRIVADSDQTTTIGYYVARIS